VPAVEEKRSWHRTGSGMARAHGRRLPSRWRSKTHAIEKGRAVASEAQCHVVILYEHPLLGERIMPMN